MRAKKRHHDGHKTVMDDLLLKRPGVRPGQMMGHPAYYLHGNMFAAVLETAVIFKVPADYAESRIGEPGVTAFQPGGHPMRGWIQVDRKDSDDFRDEMHLIQTSLAFVGALPAKKPKGKRSKSGE